MESRLREIKGCRHLQELAVKCVQSVQVKLDAAIETAVARITEDVTKAITSFLSHAPSFCRTLDQNRPARYRLSFMNALDTEVFTKKVISATDGEPIKIRMLVNDQQGSEETELRRMLSAKIKVVALNGDFNKDNHECWTSEEFKQYIVVPRDSVGSVLTGVSELSLKNGEAFLHGVALNDISKFVRSGKFRLGVMLIDDNIGERVLEGITEPFIVKDRRGEGSKKHDIPLLNDDVWRLKKIAKDGVFHEALKDGEVNYVKDFLRLHYQNEQALRKILIKAPKRVWTTIVEHAKKCDPGKELYSFVVQGHNTTLFFNSVCQIIGATFGDSYTPFSDLDMDTKKVVLEWSKVAYKCMTFHHPDYELSNGRPRLVIQSAFHELSMLEHKSTDLIQGPNEKYICQTDDHQDSLGPNSRHCKLKRMGSLRVTQNDEDASFDFSLCLDPISEQYCASTSVNDITGSVTLHCDCATNTGNEITGSVVLTQAPLTTDQQSYNVPPFTDNDASDHQSCENQPVRAQFGHSLSSIRAMLDSPIYSRHSSFDSDCHQAAAAVGAGSAL